MMCQHEAMRSIKLGLHNKWPEHFTYVKWWVAQIILALHGQTKTHLPIRLSCGALAVHEIDFARPVLGECKTFESHHVQGIEESNDS